MILYNTIVLLYNEYLATVVVVVYKFFFQICNVECFSYAEVTWLEYLCILSQEVARIIVREAIINAR